MEAVPKIRKLCGKKLDKGFMNGPRCVNWMGAAKISYGEFNRLENIFTSEDDIYPYISWSGNYEVVVNAAFRRADEVEDDRIKVLMKMIHTKHDFSEHVWEFEETPDFSWGLHEKQGEDDEVAENDEEAPKNDEEDGSDEDFRTPRGSSNKVSGARKGKKRLPDRGMEKRKQKSLSSRPQQAPFNEDMKSFMAQLFEQNFSAMEERLKKHMGERFEKMQSELKGSLKDANVEVDNIEPSTSKPSPSKPSPIKPSPSKPSSSKPPPSIPSTRRSKRLDVNLSQADDMDEDIGTQGLEGLSQSSYVPGFDPSQTNKDNEARDWWTPMTTVQKLPKVEPMEETAAPSLTKWERWCKGPSKKLELSDSQMADDAFNLTVAQRIFTPGKWLGNEEMDVMMYMWRENTTLRRNHWISVCVNIIEKKVEAFDCQRGRNRQYIEKFAAMIPRIVKAVAPPEIKKQLLLSPYSIVDVPMKSSLNKSCADCGVYALKHLECLLLGLDLSLVDDEII
uniref:Ubiquitin-like protease family profile domain-containing protein n=1 Tax=Brassica oleracea var. oleracea TaxID=109376 RepID=A0A0D3AST8_BRAOL